MTSLYEGAGLNICSYLKGLSLNAIMGSNRKFKSQKVMENCRLSQFSITMKEDFSNINL